MTVSTDTQPKIPVQSRIDPWLVRLPLLFMSGLILLLSILTALAGVAQIAFRDRVLAGVSAFEVDLSGMSVEQATEALAQRFSYDQSAVFTFRDGEQFWQINAGELGVSFDPQATATEAFAIGHSGNAIMNTIDQFLIWLNGHRVTPVIRYDQNVATERIAQIAADINREPADATFSINGTTVSSTPSAIGEYPRHPFAVRK